MVMRLWSLTFASRCEYREAMPESLNTAAAVIARLRGFAEAKGWSKSRFAAEAGLVDTTLRAFHEPNWNPTRETIEKLEALVPSGWQLGDPIEPTLREERQAAASAAGTKRAAASDAPQEPARPAGGARRAA
jgi:transcriptional regulator with XRE-family HTH domain